jgi:hypothetical protein
MSAVGVGPIADPFRKAARNLTDLIPTPRRPTSDDRKGNSGLASKRRRALQNTDLAAIKGVEGVTRVWSTSDSVPLATSMPAAGQAVSTSPESSRGTVGAGEPGGRAHRRFATPAGAPESRSTRSPIMSSADHLESVGWAPTLPGLRQPPSRTAARNTAVRKSDPCAAATTTFRQGSPRTIDGQRRPELSDPRDAEVRAAGRRCGPILRPPALTAPEQRGTAGP